MQIIDNYASKELYCLFCGTDKSVKYLLTIKDKESGKPLGTVCCCNRCAALQEGLWKSDE